MTDLTVEELAEIEARAAAASEESDKELTEAKTLTCVHGGDPWQTRCEICTGEDSLRLLLEVHDLRALNLKAYDDGFLVGYDAGFAAERTP